jgi:CubicO group peptidase (beta-lactamase class C family)
MVYSNGGYIVLGLIIEEVTGQSYYDFVIENIFEPCGMPNTDSYETDEVVPNLALGYSMRLSDDGTLRSNVLDTPGKGSSAGGGYSTVEDLLNFSHCLLNHQLLNPELTKILLEGKVEFPELGPDIKYGYGFIDRRILGQRSVGHSGGARGICANLEIFLDLGYTIVVLSNRDVNCHHVRTHIRVNLLP